MLDYDIVGAHSNNSCDLQVDVVVMNCALSCIEQRGKERGEGGLE
jgi:hypothetical protein